MLSDYAIMCVCMCGRSAYQKKPSAGTPALAQKMQKDEEITAEQKRQKPAVHVGPLPSPKTITITWGKPVRRLAWMLSSLCPDSR